MEVQFLIANVIVLATNVAVLGLTIKLYTEHFKDRSQELNHKNRTL